MEMKVVISGLGAAIPRTGLGVNIISGSYITFRNSKIRPYILMGLADAISIGNKSGTVIIGHVATDWFFVDHVKHNWLTNTNHLIGKKAEIEMVGTLIVNGKVDFKFTIYDKYGNKNELISKVDIKSSGIQAANTKVRGVLKRIK